MTSDNSESRFERHKLLSKSQTNQQLTSIILGREPRAEFTLQQRRGIYTFTVGPVFYFAFIESPMICARSLITGVMYYMNAVMG